MKKEKTEEMKFGGQAVIEGVMIKGPRHAAVAVRDEEGRMKISRREVSAGRRVPFGWPVLRGLVVFWQTLAIGMWALDFSAREAAGETEDSPWMMAATMVFAFVLGGALFFYLPLLLTQLARNYLFSFLEAGLAFNIVDGIIRMMVFLAYIILIGFIPGIKRVFEYHGAEHKVVTAYEKEEKIDPEAARVYSTLHPRCGTAFLLTVMVISILFFSLIPSKEPFIVKLAWRILLLPVIAGTSYEFIRFSEKPAGQRYSWLLAPGLWLQKLTTKEPDDLQLAVAAAAMGEVLKLEGIEYDR